MTLFVISFSISVIIFFFTVCMDGYYGDNCETPCGNCLNMEVCDKQNGTCYHGCMNHFKEPKCDGKMSRNMFFIANFFTFQRNCFLFITLKFSVVCEDGFYNGTCSAECGKCVNNESCDKETGECENGCHLQFNPPLCQGIWYFKAILKKWI